MSDIVDMKKLLTEISGHIKSGTKPDKRKAARKLKQLAAIATTLGFSIELRA